MATTGEQIRRWQGHAVLSYGFRPFFLAAALWAMAGMALWLAMLMGRAPLPLAFDPVTWHAHEFLYGYLGAVIGGFLLTAVPNWTGRLPVVGWPLLRLLGLWVAGRLAIGLSALWPPLVVALIDIAFLSAMAAFLTREIVAGRNWKNLVVLALLLAMIAGNALFHWDASSGTPSGEGSGVRLGLASAVMFIAVIGGRIVPSFTRNWLVQRDDKRRPAPPMQRFDRLALLILAAALILWVLLPGSRLSGLALLMAGVLQLIRLVRWQGAATASEPLLWVLHLGYAFVPLGAGTLGVAILWAQPSLAAAGLHLWTIGAIGTMTLGVMTRATLGHTGASLHAGPATVLLYLALPAAVLCRLAAALVPNPQGLLFGAGLFWIAGFGGFALVYGPRLMRPRGAQG